MDYDLLRETCDVICAQRWVHHLLRIGFGAMGAGALSYFLGRPDWQAVLITTITAAGIHLYSSRSYKFDIGDHAADAAYITIGASSIPIAKMQKNKKWVALGAVGLYILAYPRSSP